MAFRCVFGCDFGHKLKDQNFEKQLKEKLDKSALKSEKGILIVNYEYNDNDREVREIFFS